MAILKVFVCDACSKEEREIEEGEGVMGWTQYNGVKVNHSINPLFCPECTAEIASYIDSFMSGENNDVD